MKKAILAVILVAVLILLSSDLGQSVIAYGYGYGG